MWANHSDINSRYTENPSSNKRIEPRSVFWKFFLKKAVSFFSRHLALTLALIIIFSLTVFFSIQSISGEFAEGDNFFANLHTVCAKQRYKFNDWAALNSYRLKQSVSNTFIDFRDALFTAGAVVEQSDSSARTLIEVSESGQPWIDARVKAAASGDEDKPIYFQYLPVPSISNFSTAVQTAGAVVSYPIHTSPGPGGFKPSLSLSYSSAGVDELLKFVSTDKQNRFVRQSGPLGLGWGVSGGNFGISIDTNGDIHEKENWRYYLNFPGGAAELIKVDSEGNLINRDKKNSWEDGQWAADPELFIRILEAPSGYDTQGPRWRIKTADGTEFTFEGVDKSVINVWCLPQNQGTWGETCDWRCTEIQLAWNLKNIKNPLGQEINYHYERFTAGVSVPGDLGCSNNYVGRSAIKSINYGSNEIEFIYGQNREDWRIVKEKGSDDADDGSYVLEKRDSGQLRHQANNDAIISLTDKALSSIRVKTNGNLLKQYNLSYYDNFTVRNERIAEADVRGVIFGADGEKVLGTAWCGHCPKDAAGNYINCCPTDDMHPDCTNFNGEGCFRITDDDDDDVDKCNEACVAAGNDSGWCSTQARCEEEFNAIPLGNPGDHGCVTEDSPQCCCIRQGRTPQPGYWVYGEYNLNDGIKSYHLHLKSIQEVGTDGSTSLPAQTFTYQLIPYRRWWDNGGTTIDRDALNSIYIEAANNGYGGKVEYGFANLQQPVKVCYSDGTCKIDSKNANVKHNGKEVNFSLQRAKIQRTTTHNGMGEWWQTDYIYSDDFALAYMKKDPRQYDFLGYSDVSVVVGRKGKNLAWGFTYHPDNILSASRTFFHQSISSSGCFRKDPRAGLDYKSWVLGGAGEVFSEVLKDYKFSDSNDCWSVKPGQIPLLVETKSASTNTSTPFSPVNSTQTLYGNYCNSGNCARTKTQSDYNWDFGRTAVQNRNERNFAETIKQVDYKDIDRSDDESTHCMYYTSQVEGSNWLLSLPKASWIQDGSTQDCRLPSDEPPSRNGPAKYQFKQFYYDGRNAVSGSLPVSNPKGLATKTETIETRSGERIASHNEYDNYGNIIKQTDQKGNSSFTRYYPGGIYPKETENALGHKKVTDYDFTLGVPTKVTGPNGSVIEYAYDALGRLTRVAKPGDSLANPSSSFEYFINDSSKNAPLAVYKVTKVNQSGESLESYDFYNGIGQKFQTQALEPDGRALSNANEVNSLGKTTSSYLPFKHNDFGKAVNAPSGAGKSQTEYDIRGRAWKSTTPDGRVTKSLFREADYLSASVDSENRVVVNKQEGRVSKTITCREKNGQICSEHNGLTATAYQDILGNIIKIVNSKRQLVTESGYDTLGRKQWTADADLGRHEYNYDKNGNLIQQKDPLGNKITFGFDKLNRIEWKKFNGGQKVSYQYDDCSYGKGRKCVFEDDYQRTTYSYDQRGQLLLVDKSFAGKDLADLFGNDAFVTRFQYDNIGRQIAVTYPQTNFFDAETVNFDYEGIYLRSAKGKDTYLADTSYNIFGQVNRRVLGNQIVENYDYNNLNQRLTHIEISSQETEYADDSSSRFHQHKILDLEYANYSPAGNILSIKDNIYDEQSELSMDQNFVYDNFYRLISASGTYDAEFRYDDLDRMEYKKEGSKEHSYVFDNSFPYHGVKSVNDAQISYNLKGEILSYDINGLNRDIEWDHSIGKPRKITAHPPEGDLVAATFYYDGEGNRIAKKVGSDDYTLYINSLLEKTVAGGEVTWRKNYMAGSNLAAVRNVSGESVERKSWDLSISAECPDGTPLGKQTKASFAQWPPNPLEWSDQVIPADGGSVLINYAGKGSVYLMLRYNNTALETDSNNCPHESMTCGSKYFNPSTPMFKWTGDLPEGQHVLNFLAAEEMCFDEEDTDKKELTPIDDDKYEKVSLEASQYEQVDMKEVIETIFNYGDTSENNPLDKNNDGIVNGLDLIITLSNLREN